MCHWHHALQIELHTHQLPPTYATDSLAMAPIRSSKSLSSFLQPPKGTQHKQRACKHVRNKSSESDNSETQKKTSTACKCKHDSASSADEAMGSHSTKKKKKLTASVDTADKGDGSEDETSPQDDTPEDMDENDQALSTSLTPHWLHFSYLRDRESHGRLDISSLWPLSFATLHQSWRRHG